MLNFADKICMKTDKGGRRTTDEFEEELWTTSEFDDTDEEERTAESSEYRGHDSVRSD